MKNKIAFKALLKKDIKTFFLNKQVVISISLLIGIFCVLYPLIFALGITAGSGSELYPEDLGDLGNDVISALKTFYGYICIFLILIPLMMGNLLGNSIITIEKESKTLETILYCPMQTKDLIKTKILVTFIPGMIVTFGSFLLSILIVNLVTLGNGFGVFLPNLNSLLTFILLAPAIMFLALLFTVKLSAKSENSTQAQQKSIVFILPLMLITSVILSIINFLSPVIGVVVILIFFIATLFVSFFLYKDIIKNFTPEFLLK